MIDRATIDRIMDATDIVDVISEFVTLRKRGTSYTGLCPINASPVARRAMPSTSS